MSDEAKPNVATMTADELWEHIKKLDFQHKQLLRTLRALRRVRWEEERDSRG